MTRPTVTWSVIARSAMTEARSGDETHREPNSGVGLGWADWIGWLWKVESDKRAGEKLSFCARRQDLSKGRQRMSQHTR
jgi:hypothetical protein